MIQTANDIFVLHTEHTTYAFRKLPTGQLEHLYYGRKIHVCEPLDENAVAPLIEKHTFQPGNSCVYDREHDAYTLEDLCLEMSAYGMTVFSQRSPRAVRSLLGGVRLSAPALVCGGTLAYNFSEGSGTALCSFEGMEESVLKMLPSLSGVGIALQMRDGSTRAVRMSEGLVFHLKQEWTPFVLSNAADVKGEDVLRILFYQDKKQMPILPTLQKTLGDAAAFLHAERLAPDTLVLTPGLVSGSAMLNAVCPPSGYAAEQLTVLAGCTQMLDLVHLAGESVVPADAAPELRLAANRMTLTDHDTGAAAELLYGMVRRAETSA
mgnify:CR=1 FL=1